MNGNLDKSEFSDIGSNDTDDLASFIISRTASRNCCCLVAFGDGHVMTFRDTSVDIYHHDLSKTNDAENLRLQNSEVRCATVHGELGLIILLGSRKKPYNLRLYNAGADIRGEFIEQDISSLCTGIPLYLFVSDTRLYIQCFDMETYKPSLRIESCALTIRDGTGIVNDDLKIHVLPSDIGRVLAVDDRGRFLGLSSSLRLYLVDNNTANYLDILPYVENSINRRIGVRSGCFAAPNIILVAISSQRPYRTTILRVEVTSNGLLLPPSVILDKEEQEAYEVAEIALSKRQRRIFLLMWDERGGISPGDEIRCYSLHKSLFGES